MRTVSLRWAAPVNALDVGAVSLGGRTVRCRWVIGADGTDSRVGDGPLSIRRGAVSRGSGCVSIFVSRHGPTTSRSIGASVARSTKRRSDRRDMHRSHRRQGRPVFRGPGGIVSRAWSADCGRGADDLDARGDFCIHRVAAGDSRAARAIGDASGSVDAITGEGLALAFRQAAILAEALSRDDLAIYQAAHRRIGRIPRLMSRLMLGLGGRTGMRRRALRVLACWPRCSTGCWRFMWERCGRRRPHLDFVGLPGGC